MKKSLATVLIATSLTFAASVSASDFYVSAKSVQALNGDLSSVSPAVLTPSNASDYLDSGSALGYYGPIGPYGPLGVLGPVGDNSWNVSYWISAIGDWSDWSDDMSDHGGPLSEAGPLGPNGPLSDQAYFQDLPAINDFGKQLQAGGVWGVLGPVGPLGALGPLGPLGPVGAHGYDTNSNGQYLLNDQEVRAVEVPYEGSARTYELVEHYTESYAKSKTDNDTSFMASAYIAWPYSEVDTYTFTSNSDQFVTVVLIPEYQMDDFDLIITDENGNVLVDSNSFSFIDWVQIPVEAGTTLKAKVELAGTWHWASKNYRMIVTGSTEYLNTTDISGDHQVSMAP
jgi:hypothetical protein